MVLPWQFLLTFDTDFIKIIFCRHTEEQFWCVSSRLLEKEYFLYNLHSKHFALQHIFSELHWGCAQNMCRFISMIHEVWSIDTSGSLRPDQGLQEIIFVSPLYVRKKYWICFNTLQNLFIWNNCITNILGSKLHMLVTLWCLSHVEE